MAGGMLGLIVAGGDPTPCLRLDGTGEPALTPFAGKYRFIDFALATLRNSGVRDVRIVAPPPATSLVRHLREALPAIDPTLGSPVLHPEVLPAGGRIGRLVQALRAARGVLQALEPDAVAVLHADHILLLDLRQLAAAHESRRSDATLPALPLPRGEVGSRIVLCAGRDERVSVDAEVASDASASEIVLTWAGDALLRATALRPLLEDTTDEGGSLERWHELVRRGTVHAYNVLENQVPGARAFGGYWHEPMSLEAYYGAQMELCTERAPLDLYNPAWPLPSIASGLAPAKVVTDGAGRAGQALDTLVSDGSIIRGGVVIKSVLGQRVIVESGAEVEDSLLLDGCRIGRCARVRRAVVGPGVVIADGEEIGFGGEPAAPGRLLRSGLTVLPSPAAVLD